uniref:Glutathione S-transferase n=1 Tax=Craspedostauros australis TaxID=1486917 RepID=A0A7R9ZQ82_9STRA|mmetsp:Transcript_5618/g.15228  ORF Transcript_5618/g.15228 Transcript_5618/m.15228 type:complete len:236 (+) Transcript_5618:105-812(+)
MTPPTLTLTYFGIAGAAEPIRLAAAIGKVPYIHKSLEFKDWPEYKKTTPVGLLPLLEVDNGKDDKQVIPESVAILRYFGKLGGLYPTDPLEALKVDSIVDSSLDSMKAIALTVQGSVTNMISDEPWTKEEVAAIRKRIATTKDAGLLMYMAYLNGVLEKNGSGWFVGDSVTIADLMVLRVTSWVGSGMLDGIPPETLDPFPLIKAHMEKIAALPEVKEFRDKHTTPYGNFKFGMK